MVPYKIIYEPVHGSMKVEGLFLDLLESAEVQKLRGIKQTGFANLVFPGANHTRFEHALGTLHVASQVAHALGLDEESATNLKIASFLHDIGHGPFSHVLDFVLYNRFKLDHMKIAEQMLLGKYSLIPEEVKKKLSVKSVFEILESNHIPIERIVNIISGNAEKEYLAQLVHGSIDVDQIDFLLRDSHYTGVAYGTIDLPRLLQTMAMRDGKLVVHRRGLPAVEALLVARTLMFSSVYMHRVVRVTDLMLTRAIEQLSGVDFFDLPKLTDAELVHLLETNGGYSAKIMQFLRYRRLFKTVYIRSAAELDTEKKSVLQKLEKSYESINALECKICDTLKIPRGDVIIDLPAVDIMHSEPRIAKIDVQILDDDDNLLPLEKCSSLSKAVEGRCVTGWLVMVIANPSYSDVVSKKIEKLLFE